MSINSLALIGVAGIVVYALAAKVIPDNPFDDKGKKENIGQRLIGQSCNENSDCSMKMIVPSSEGGNLESAIGCCNNVCQARKQGLLGIYSCRDVNEDAPDIEKMAKYYVYGGDDKDYVYKTREIGSACRVNEDCGRFGMNNNTPSDGTESGCYKGQCTFKKRDWAGNLYWPDVCKGEVNGSPGTCNSNNNRTEAEIKYREWWNGGKHDNPGLQPKYKPSMTKEQIEKYFK
jgi:hypothetical protein